LRPEFKQELKQWLSPSHTVGFEPYKLVKGLVETLLRESPSHAVGLERLVVFQIGIRLAKSPSHPVGLKHLPKNPENQSLNPLKIKTAHREGTLTHIQLPS